MSFKPDHCVSCLGECPDNCECCIYRFCSKPVDEKLVFFNFYRALCYEDSSFDKWFKEYFGLC